MASSTANNPESTPFLRLAHLFLNYGRAPVLKDVTFSLNRGEIHALVGEHGAGKSSLCGVLAGELKPSSGEIRVNDAPYPALNAKIARQHRIQFVHQHHLLFENLSIAENLFVSHDADPSPIYNYKKLVATASAYFEQFGVNLNPELKLKTIDPADRSLIGILKQLYLQPQFFILDETLDTLKTDVLHKVVEWLSALKQQGGTILFVTHRIDEIYQIADQVTVMKDGQIFFSDAVKNIDKLNLIKFAYTEISKPAPFGLSKEEFYQILKYNEAVLQNLPVNLIVIDNDLRVKLINERARRLFKLERAEYYNTPLAALLQPPNAAMYALIAEAYRHGQTETFYNVSMAAGETTLRNNIILTPIYDGAFLIGTIISIEDISEQERLREQVAFSEKLASTGLLAAGVAHEINNPLEIIHNYLEYLKYGIQDQQQLEILETLNRQTEAIAHIVSNLVIFSDHSHAGLETFDLNTLIERIIGLIRHNARHRQITVTFKESAEPLMLQANKTELQQVILNLFKNSFDAMPDGGEIVIRTALRRQEQTRSAEIIVQDTGPGIQSVNPHDIFLPFYSTRHGKAGHLGLGLSVSYGIIAKYHGAMTVKNLAGKGCQFTIALPL